MGQWQWLAAGFSDTDLRYGFGYVREKHLNHRSIRSAIVSPSASLQDLDLRSASFVQKKIVVTISPSSVLKTCQKDYLKLTNFKPY